MGLNLISDQDVAKVQSATTKVITDAIAQAATVLVPAIAEAAKGSLSGITVTIGPITIEPIKITVGEQ